MDIPIGPFFPLYNIGMGNDSFFIPILIPFHNGSSTLFFSGFGFVLSNNTIIDLYFCNISVDSGDLSILIESLIVLDDDYTTIVALFHLMAVNMGVSFFVGLYFCLYWLVLFFLFLLFVWNLYAVLFGLIIFVGVANSPDHISFCILYHISFCHCAMAMRFHNFCLMFMDVTSLIFLYFYNISMNFWSILVINFISFHHGCFAFFFDYISFMTMHFSLFILFDL